MWKKTAGGRANWEVNIVNNNPPGNNHLFVYGEAVEIVERSFDEGYKKRLLIKMRDVEPSGGYDHNWN